MIIGLNELQRKLDRMSRIAPDLVPVVSSETQKVVTEAKARCPVDTGALRESITGAAASTDEAATGTAYTDKDYAGAVEQGTFRTPARPFMYPALKDNEDDITAAIAREAREAVLRAVT